MSEQALLLIIGSIAGLITVFGFISKAMILNFIKQQEKITQAFLDSVNNSIQAQVQQTEASRDVAENLKCLTEKVCEQGNGIKQISEIISHRILSDIDVVKQN